MNREDDDLHLGSEGNNGLADVKIQVIDRVNGEEKLRERRDSGYIG